MSSSSCSSCSRSGVGTLVVVAGFFRAAGGRCSPDPRRRSAFPGRPARRPPAAGVVARGGLRGPGRTAVLGRGRPHGDVAVGCRWCCCWRRGSPATVMRWSAGRSTRRRVVARPGRPGRASSGVRGHRGLRPGGPGPAAARPPQAALAEAVAQLRRSRVGLVDAFETERRRIERDLHDGVQQRLVALTMTLGSAELEVAEDPGLTPSRGAPPGRAGPRRAARHVRGIHPRVLSTTGWRRPCTRSRTAPGPGHLDIRPTTGCRRRSRPRRTSSSARPSPTSPATPGARAQVHAWRRGPRVVLPSVDDGDGGADTGPAPASRTAVRLDALDGTWT